MIKSKLPPLYSCNYSLNQNKMSEVESKYNIFGILTILSVKIIGKSTISIVKQTLLSCTTVNNNPKSAQKISIRQLQITLKCIAYGECSTKHWSRPSDVTVLAFRFPILNQRT